MNDLINNFNYDSPELREQLDTIGMTPDEVKAQFVCWYTWELLQS